MYIMLYPQPVRWPWSRDDAQPEALLSVSDPALAAYFYPGGLVDLSATYVGELEALGLSAMYRALMLISGTLASLPLRTFTGGTDAASRRQVSSVFDDPDGPDGQTSYEWKETLFLHLLLHGKAGAMKVRTQAGGLTRLPLVHPLAFSVRQPTPQEFENPETLPAGGVWFDINLRDGERVSMDADDFWYVPGPSLGGQWGINLLASARRSLATTIAGDKAAGALFSNGALISGLATPADDYDITDDVPEIRRQLNQSVGGVENAGAIAVVNRRLNFTPWTMTSADAQFLQSRQFQIEEISRWTGVPPHLLMQTDKQTSWGTGVDEQNRGLSKFVLGHWAQRVEQRGSRLLANPRWCEFDFAGLERPNFAVEVGLLIQQVNAGLLTLNEARAIRNLPPLPETPDATPNQDGGADDPTSE
jgi:HK97 family phage portal protein